MLNSIKIIATLGPNIVLNQDLLVQMLQDGIDCFRINASHLTSNDLALMYEKISSLMIESKNNTALMLDTKGPEIRIKNINHPNQELNVNNKQIITIIPNQRVNSTSWDLSIDDEIFKQININDELLFDDGKLITRVIKKMGDLIQIEAFNNHQLKINKRINIPTNQIKLNFLSEKDKQDIEFAISKKFNYIALSFVSCKQDILEVKNMLTSSNTKLIAKIESQASLNHLEEIIDIADGIMIARGDLGLEVKNFTVPLWQELIIKKCNEKMKPVIVATQMLDSMENHLCPTRAEVSDVYWAVKCGCDATMLSGETAIGKFPLQTITEMKEITNFSSYVNPIKYYFKKNDEWNKIIINHGIKYILLDVQDITILEQLLPFHSKIKIIVNNFNLSTFNKYGLYRNLFFPKRSFNLNQYQDLIRLQNDYGCKNGEKILLVNDDELKIFNINV